MAVIIFDFDGTIADSFDYVANFLVNASGQPALNDDQKIQLHGMSMVAMARLMGFRWWRLPNLFFKGRNRMGNVIKELKPFKKMPELIAKLHSEGHELFIISSNSLRNVHKFLQHYNLNHYFLEVYGGVGMFSKAPAIKKLLKEQKLAKEDAIFVGDELRDVEAAQSVGLRVVAVTWGFARIETLRAKKPTGIAYTPEDLLSILENV